MIPPQGCFDHDAMLHADLQGGWIGAAADDGRVSLIGPRPSIAIRDARLTLTRRPGTTASQALATAAHVDCGDAPTHVLRDGDRLSCHRGLDGAVGMSLVRHGRLQLYLGASAGTGETRLRTEHDPRVEQTVLARHIRYISQPGTRHFWLDPSHPAELQDRLQEIDQDHSAVLRAIVVRTDDDAVRLDLNRKTMQTGRYRQGAAIFLTASERFPTFDAWMAYGRSLPTERPADLWLRVRIDDAEQHVPQGTTTTIGDAWLVHVHRVYEPGVPGSPSILGIAARDAGVSASTLESSAAAVARGVRIERSA